MKITDHFGITKTEENTISRIEKGREVEKKLWLILLRYPNGDYTEEAIKLIKEIREERASKEWNMIFSEKNNNSEYDFNNKTMIMNIAPYNIHKINQKIQKIEAFRNTYNLFEDYEYDSKERDDEAKGILEYLLDKKDFYLGKLKLIRTLLICLLGIPLFIWGISYVIGISEKLPEPIDRNNPGKVYKWKTLKDGNNWMIENLAFEAENGFYCYNDDSLNCNSMGMLYPNMVIVKKGICPKGWEIPTKEDWKNMLSQYGKINMKTGRINEKFFSNLANIDALNIKLTGQRTNENKYQDQDKYGYYWARAENGSCSYIQIGKSELYFFNSKEGFAFSCRCFQKKKTLWEKLFE